MKDYQAHRPGTELRQMTARDTREDLLSQSGLLLPQGERQAAFYHFTIQDFLAAERLYDLHPEKVIDVFRQRGQFSEWRKGLGLLFGALLFKRSTPDEAIRVLSELINFVTESLRGGEVLGSRTRQSSVSDPNSEVSRLRLRKSSEVLRDSAASSGATRLLDAPWKLGIVLGDCWRVLRGHGQALNSDVQQRFVEFCPSAIDHEAPIKDRVELALALGRIGNPRVPSSLNDPQAWVELPAGTYQLGEADNRNALPPEIFNLSEPVKISRYLVTRRCNSREADLGCTSPVGSFPRGRSWCGVAGFAPQHARQLSAALRASLDFLRLV